jgi:hypothetical protein
VKRSIVVTRKRPGVCWRSRDAFGRNGVGRDPELRMIEPA